MAAASTAPVALVTGGAGGIGRATARAFAQRGYRVAVADIDGAAAQAVAESLRSEGHAAESITVDIGDRDAVVAMLDGLRARYGRLDAAFNNAGASSLRVPLADLDEADWERVLRTNLTGTFLCMKYEIRWMLEQGHGCIVNNCSVFGIGGSISATYTASKHGIAGLTRSAAISYARCGVRINAVCPGLIDAGMGARYLERAGETDAASTIALHPAGRAGTAEEVADAVLWLCSEESRYVHGHLLAVDGGYGAR
ncbi:SDR family NAD(P)-dependent oxidoreductase [Sinimarinibacterium thermocellulolyticum]|uniref:SDR family oxidoreductase n=1 Tax=Sinimarinibacterium thermocellulolyticum TaxID=3170016 RepID=A0ABV2A798_9GAMM